ncbi:MULTISPECIES: enoyl-CoA hydratase/isomerase family protein [Streptomyces]|uniref:Enoyl-CoA hydratase/isomerase family protein n=1 Tax=Streptomyces flaveolus TaxID=67297 RepID=A0ABV3ALV1_9ACTN|nr:MULTISPECIES: enoyl-CoA hydratase/isomerase family protein [Streptomyces]
MDRSDPRVWRITFDHPPLNLIDRHTISELTALVEELEQDPDVRVVVFDSAVPDFFLAHYDVDAPPPQSPPPAGPTGLPPWLDVLARIAEGPFVSIAKIRGRARGAGSEFVLACDMRYAGRENAVLSQPEIGLGLVAGGAPTHRLPFLTGRGRALEIMLTGQDYDADLAERYGYVDRAVPDSDLDGFVTDVAERVASFDKVALVEVKDFVGEVTLPAHALQARTGRAFWTSAARPASRRRLDAAREQGLGRPGDFEMRMGRHLPGLDRSADPEGRPSS